MKLSFFPGVATFSLGLSLLSICTAQAGQAELHLDTSLPAGKGLVAQTQWLDIQVNPVAGDKVTVKADLYLEASGSDESVKKTLENQRVVAERSGEDVVIRQEKVHGYSGNSKSRGSLVIGVPAGVSLRLLTGSGDVVVTGVMGNSDAVVETGSGNVAFKDGFSGDELHASTGSGDVVLSGQARILKVEAASGDVRIKVAQPLEQLVVDSASGDVTLEGGAYRADVDTASGEITLANLQGSVEADAASGDITLGWGQVVAGSRISADTASGDVVMLFPAGLDLGGNLSTSSGRIQFPSGNATFKDAREVALKGTHAQVEANTVSGDVRLEWR